MTNTKSAPSDEQNQTHAGGLSDEAAATNYVSVVKEGSSLEDGEGERDMLPVIDEARFQAGIVKLYEAVQNEPIPDEIMALIEKMAGKERL